MHSGRPATLAARLCALLLALAGAIAPPAAAPATAQGAATRVYVLRGGDTTSDAAVADSLRARGFTVDLGVDAIAFNGSQAALARYNAVVLLYGRSWTAPIPAGGVSALTGYVQNGGSLITGEWAVSDADLGGLTPATSCGSSALTGTTYRQLSANPVLSNGLPASFSVALPAAANSEACLEPRPDATVLFQSANGDPRLRAGLAAWSVGAGKVASFSIRLGATELQSASLRRLLQNTVLYLADPRDTIPPTLRSFSFAGAGSLVGSRRLSLQIVASDSGGSGMGSAYVAEYVFSGNPDDPWLAAQKSGWVSYGPPRLDLSWQLDPTPGVHYLQAFVADRAGNMSTSPALTFVSYQPAQVDIALNELRIYRISARAGAQVSVRMDVTAGNPDLYVFGPGVSFAPESDAPIEQTSFTAQSGVYQIEVEGFQAGSYTLSGAASPNAAAARTPPGLQRRSRGSIIFLARFEPGPDQAVITPPPLNKTYLPMLLSPG